MADMNYTQDAGGYNLSTGAGPNFTAPGGMADMSGFFNALAAKKAAAQKQAAEEDRRRWEAEFRLKEQAMQPQEMPQAPAAPAFTGGYVDVINRAPLAGMGPTRMGRAWSMDPAAVAAGRAL